MELSNEKTDSSKSVSLIERFFKFVFNLSIFFENLLNFLWTFLLPSIFELISFFKFLISLLTFSKSLDTSAKDELLKIEKKTKKKY